MKPHLAFLPSPGMGHTIPVFQLARRLSLHHHLPVSFFIITTDTSNDAKTRFFNQQAALLPQDFRLINLPAAADVSSLITDDMPVVTQLCIMVHESLKNLKSSLAAVNPDALIVDIFTTEAIDACNELSIPVYSFFTASTHLLAFSLYLPTLDREVEGEYVDLPAPVDVPGCSPIKVDDLIGPAKNRKIDDYKWYLFHARRLLLVRGIFINTWEAFDPLYLNALRENNFYTSIPIPPIYPIGPLIKDEEFLTEKDQVIMDWLQNQPHDSVLFISFGSGGALTRKELTELAAGLEMSRQRFILVVRRPIDVQSNASASFFDPDNGEDPSVYLPEGFVERTRGTGLVVANWAPQVAVLRSASTGGFMSHCGWNSTLESLVHGVPMIAWPLYAEQHMSAAVLVEEIGVAVRAAVMERKEVERVVRAVMEGEEGKGIRRRAKELEETAAKAVSSAGSSFEALARAVEVIGKSA